MFTDQGRHLNMFIFSCLVRFYQSTHDCCSTKTTIYETLLPWPIGRWWCRFPFLLCSQTITSVSSVHSSRFLELLSSRNHLPVSWVWTVLLNSLQLTAHAMGNEQKKIVIMSSSSNIIYQDEQHQIFYPSSCLFMYFLTQGHSSSITSRDNCFTVPIGLCMTEPEGFDCAGIYTLFQGTICFE